MNPPSLTQEQRRVLRTIVEEWDDLAPEDAGEGDAAIDELRGWVEP